MSLRSSHLQVISLCAITKWTFWSLDIKNASLRADGFTRDDFLRAPEGWGQSHSEKVWTLKAPAHGLNDVPVAPHRSLKKYVLNSEASMKIVGLRYRVSTFDPCLFSIFREAGCAVGVFATHIDDILGRGGPDVLAKIRAHSEKRFGELKLQEPSFVHVAMELVQEGDFPVTSKQEEFTQLSKPLPTSPQVRAAR